MQYLPTEQISTFISSWRISRAQFAGANDVKGVVSQDTVGDFMTNMFSNANNVATKFRRMGQIGLAAIMCFVVD